ncbi:protein SCO1/2 [Variovorax boronicumulans]|uniref:SCO family protein n=1 Tax=Variovorax TaxID=34072 RepID=UPI00277D812E|nr:MULTISPECIES: SCO family protein [Variovorax]MDQ0037644.1 protein SCO1/2 [Variovorax boronicumulans]MDQ0606008.1 protein SCO1/2 [Variovorax sp. W1I1]
MHTTRPRQLSRRHLLIAGGGLAALSLAACDKVLPVSFNGIDITGANYAQDFRLTDPDGRERTVADFKGKAVMLFFGFTQCPDVCPTALLRAAEIRHMLGADGERLQVIFVTVDPERDTPVVLKAYTNAFDPSFIGLYGDLQRTSETAKAFKAYYKKVPTGASYTMDHSAFSYVYDPQGQIRLVLRHEQGAPECAEDLRKILKTTA